MALLALKLVKLVEGVYVYVQDIPNQVLKPDGLLFSIPNRDLL